MIPPGDEFWDVRAKEEIQLKRLEAELDGVDRAIALAKRVLSIRHASGFAEFLKAVEDLRSHAERQLVGCMASDSYMRQLQGKAQALSDVLTILRNSENSTGQLVARRQELQNELDDAHRRRPKPRTED